MRRALLPDLSILSHRTPACLFIPSACQSSPNEIALGDILEVEDKDFSEDIELKDNINLLYKYLDVLTPREKRIIIDRYGLDNKKEETQKSISKKMGISRSYVSRIEKRALTKLLREFLKHNRT